MSRVIELFGHSANESNINWRQTITDQNCAFTQKKCYKTRKSEPSISIGSCSVLYGQANDPIIICPKRLLERKRIFADCIHLLTSHEPGNELHIVSEVGIPGGSVDFFLVSTKRNAIVDFVGIELQTLDTTGTVWPERQRLLRTLGVPRADQGEESTKPFGMNWKMTAKTILVQMHHKIQTFEHLNKKLVLVVQDDLLNYMRQEFSFSHITYPASLGDSMHLHSYLMEPQSDRTYKIRLDSRLSTNADGIGTCLGLQAEARIELEMIVTTLQSKISAATQFTIV